MVRLIGIAGKKYSGKDTVGDYIVSRYGYKKCAFADPIKEVCKSVFGFSDEQLNGSLKEKMDAFWLVEPRKVMQFVGTELFRNGLMQCSGLEWVGQDVWVNVVKRRIMEDPDGLIVVTDVRFANERDLIKELGGIVVRVRRDQVMCSDGHSSEIQDFEVDYEIENNGTFEELFGKVESLGIL